MAISEALQRRDDSQAVDRILTEMLDTQSTRPARPSQLEQIAAIRHHGSVEDTALHGEVLLTEFVRALGDLVAVADDKGIPTSITTEVLRKYADTLEGQS